MISPENLVLSLSLVVVAWFTSFYFIYLLTGFHIWLANPLNFEVRSLSYKNVKLSLNLRKFRFRPNIWKRHSDLIFNGVSINIKKVLLSAKKDTVNVKVESSETDDIITSIYSSNSFLRFFQRSLLTRVRNFTVILKNISIIIGDKDINLRDTIIKVSSRSKIQKKQHFSIVGSLHDLKLERNQLEKLKCEISFSIDLDSGDIIDLKIKTFMKSLSLSVSNIIEITGDSKQDPKQFNKDKESGSRRRRRIFQHLYKAIEEASFHAHGCRITEIPYLKPGDNEKYMKNESPSQYLELEAKLLSLNFSKLGKESPGFQLLFNSDDIPSQMALSLMLMKLKYIEPNFNNDGVSKIVEFLVLPNMNFSKKSNIIPRLLSGQGFENCALEGFFSVSSPILELTSQDLGLLIFNAVSLKRYVLSVNSTKHHDSVQTSTSSGVHSRLISLLSKVYPKVNLKIVIEEPSFVLKYSGLDNALKLLNFHYSILNFQVTTTKNRDYYVTLHFLQTAIEFIQKSSQPELNKVETYDSSVFRIETISLSANVLREFKVNCSLELDEVKLDLSKLVVLNGIKEIFSDVTKKIFADIRRVSDKIEIMNGEMNGDPNIKKKSGIFKSLPQWLLYISFKLNNLEFCFGSRSVFIPVDKLSSLKVPASHDFRNDDNLRIVKLSIEALEINFYNEEEDFKKPSKPLTIKGSQTNGNADSSAYWSAELCIANTISTVILDTENSDHKVFTTDSDRFLSIPLIASKLRAIHTDKLVFTGDLDKVLVDYSVFKHFAILSMIQLMSESLVKPIRSIVKSAEAKVPEKKKSSKSGASMFDFSFHIGSSDILLHLSDEFRTRFQIFDSKLTFTERNSLLIYNSFLRGLVDSPTTPGYWNRILCVDDLTVGISLDDVLNIEIINESIKLIQPHGMVVYRLFDNLSITIKAFKHLVYVVTGKASGTVVNSTVSEPLQLPEVSLKTNTFSFIMEDDPFETELNMIFQLGLAEQRQRIEKTRLFEERLGYDTNLAMHHHHQTDCSDDLNKDKRTDFLSPVTHSNDNEISDRVSEDNLYKLHKGFSDSWIRRVSVFKHKTNMELLANKKFLFGCESKLPEDSNDKVVSYLKSAPLLLILIDGLNLKLSTTKFSPDDLPKFIHDLGKGVPLDTKYSFALPAYVDLGLNELRMHMRDYPLPLLYVPKIQDENSTEPALKLSGHLVIAEAFTDKVKAIRNIYVPLVPGVSIDDPDDYYALTVQKTLTDIKIFTQLDVQFNSEYPTKFTWGQSYQPALQQILLNFDQLSKPPIDPSDKLGFWDKLRLILHGRFSLGFNDNNQLLVLFKGSRDPYCLLGDASGFVLCFRNKIGLVVNKNDDPKDFITVSSDEVQWSIPNHLAEPLLVWSRESSKALFLPSSDAFITTLFGYYLHEKMDTSRKLNLKFDDYFEKIVISFTGGVEFNVGFVFERDESRLKRTDKFKPHYEILQCHPNYASEDHDSYAGFRSEYIHMAISMKANNDNSYNTVHLTPGVFKQFFKWWHLFSSNMTLPVRNGTLYGHQMQSKKFAQHLFTNKFQILAEPLFLSHIYRDESAGYEDDHITCVGLKAKLEKCSVDMHLRKEPIVSINEVLEKSQKIMKMNLNIGEVIISNIDLRAVESTFEKNMYSLGSASDEKGSKYEIFDGDLSWFDINDYEEAFIPSLKSSKKTIKIHPLMHSERFGYYRNTGLGKTKSKDPDFQEFGNEYAHDCLLGTNDIFDSREDVWDARATQLANQIKLNKAKNSVDHQLIKRRESVLVKIQKLREEKKQVKSKTEKETTDLGDLKFHNKFFLNSMLLKWNNENRNLILKYIHYVQLTSTLSSFLSYEAIRSIEDIIEEQKNMYDTDDLSEIASRLTNKLERLKSHKGIKFNSNTLSAEERLKRFDDDLNVVEKNQAISEDYFISILSPQIQLSSDDTPGSIVLLASPNINCKIVSVVDNTTGASITAAKVLGKRHGVFLKDANIFVLDKDSLERSTDLIYSSNTYGSNSSWPPWLGLEICDDGALAGADRLLIEKTSIVVRHDSINKLNLNAYEQDNESDNEIKRDRIMIDVPKIVISCTSKQYFTLCIILINLLFYSEPSSKSLNEKLNKLILSIDFNDLGELYSRLKLLQLTHNSLNTIENNYKFRQNYLNNEDLNDFLMTNLERNNVVTELFFLLKSILTGSEDLKDSKDEFEWTIVCDQVILHMLQDNNKPFLDFTIANGVFKRLLIGNGSDHNRVEVGIMQGFNLVENMLYPDLLQPLNHNVGKKNDNLIVLDWSMNRTIGGIKIVENFEINLQPLEVKLEQITGERLMEYIFRSDGEINESPLLLSINKDKGSNKIEDESSSSDDENKFINSEDAIVTDSDTSDDSVISIIDGPDKKPSSEMKLSSNGTPPDKKSRSTTSNNSKKYKDITKVGASVVDQENEDPEVEEMIERASKYLSIIGFKINAFNMRISFRGKKGYKKLLNVENFMIKLPELIVSNKLFSLLELTLYFKSDIMKVLLSHTGRLIGNKITSHKARRRRTRVRATLKPLKEYVRFTKVSELISERDGRLKRRSKSINEVEEVYDLFEEGNTTI